MPVSGQTPTRIHLIDSPSAKWEAGAAYPDPNDSTKLVRDVDARVTGEVDVTASTSVTIDADSNPVIAMDDDSPAGAISVSLDSSVEDGFIRDVFNESTNDATLTPTSGDINDGSGAGSSATLPAGTSCRLSKSSSGSPATAHWRMLKGAGSGGGSWGSITGTLSSQTDLQAALDAKASIVGVQGQTYMAADDSGSADAYAVTISPAPTIARYTRIVFKAANANTGASTLNVNGGGAVAIKKNGASALSSGDIVAGQIVSVVNDGTNWQIVAGAIGPQGAAGSGTMSIGPITSLPATVPTSGTAYACTDADVIYISDGTNWIPYGPIHPRTGWANPSNFTFYTNVSAGHSFVFTQKGTATLYADGNTGDCIYRPNASNLPGSGMFRARALLRPCRTFGTFDLRMGIFLEDVTGAKAVSFSVSPTNGYYLYWNDITTLTFNSIKQNSGPPSVFPINSVAPIWLALLYAPTANGLVSAGVYCQFSMDGKVWHNLGAFTANVNDWMANRPTRFGAYMGSWASLHDNAMEILSLEVDQSTIGNAYEPM